PPGSAAHLASLVSLATASDGAGQRLPIECGRTEARVASFAESAGAGSGRFQSLEPAAGGASALHRRALTVGTAAADAGSRAAPCIASLASSFASSTPSSFALSTAVPVACTADGAVGNVDDDDGRSIEGRRCRWCARRHDRAHVLGRASPPLLYEGR